MTDVLMCLTLQQMYCDKLIKTVNRVVHCCYFSCQVTWPENTPDMPVLLSNIQYLQTVFPGLQIYCLDIVFVPSVL